jgi:homoserine O-acetyltransferase
MAGGRYAVESYLEYHGEKLARRFDANSYITLSEAMNHHDVGRGRGGVAAALGRVTARTTVAGISSDRLYPLRLQDELAELIPGATGVEVIESVSGHDGFLVELEAVGKVVQRALGEPA